MAPWEIAVVVCFAHAADYRPCHTEYRVNEQGAWSGSWAYRTIECPTVLVGHLLHVCPLSSLW